MLFLKWNLSFYLSFCCHLEIWKIKLKKLRIFVMLFFSIDILLQYIVIKTTRILLQYSVNKFFVGFFLNFVVSKGFIRLIDREDEHSSKTRSINFRVRTCSCACGHVILFTKNYRRLLRVREQSERKWNIANGSGDQVRGRLKLKKSTSNRVKHS